MKTLQICNQIIEECTRKEIVTNLEELIENKEEFDGSIYVEYKDGRFYQLIDGEECGNRSYKRNDIYRIIVDNGSTYQVYGKYDYYVEAECLYII